MGAVEKVHAEQVQRFIQVLLEGEVTALRERPKLTRRAGGDLPEGRRHGCGKPRRFTLTTGTITGRLPQVRGLSMRFVSRVLSRFKRRTRDMSELLPQCCMQGLALGDLELTLLGLLGATAPFSLISPVRLKAQWSELWTAEG